MPSSSWAVGRTNSTGWRSAQRQDGKDALYIHDTLQLFGTSLHELRSEWRGLEGRLQSGLGVKIEEQINRFFGTTSASAEKAAAIAKAVGRPSPPTPEALATVCRVGLGQIFTERR